MATQTTNNDQAVESFVGYQLRGIEKAQEVIKRLTAYIDHVSPERVNWAHVGDMSFVDSKLDEILNFLSPGVGEDE